MRLYMFTAAIIAASLANMAWARQPRIGPSFNCGAVHSPDSQLMCSSPDLSQIAFKFFEAYHALRQQSDPEGWEALKMEAVDSESSVLQRCGVPLTGTLPANVAGMVLCLSAVYERQRSAWLSRLSGAALREAEWPVEQHVALEHDLQALGYLPVVTTIDGVYGAATRAAILARRQSCELSTAELIGDRDAVFLAEQSNRNDTASPSSVGNSSGQVMGQLTFLRSWVGRYPDVAAPDASGNYSSLPPDKTLWANPVLRSALTTLLGKLGFKEMLSLNGPETPIERHGSWLVWSKCKEHECPDLSYTVFINPDQNDIEVCYLRIDEEISEGSVTSSSVIARWSSPDFHVPVLKHRYNGNAPTFLDFGEICSPDLVSRDPDISSFHAAIKVEFERAEHKMASFVSSEDQPNSNGQAVDQSDSLGVPPPAAASSWYYVSVAGTCARSTSPPSPGYLISFDRANGLEDNVLILKRDDAGKPSVVRVGEPEGNGMESVYMFFKEMDGCEAYLKTQQQQINDLR